MICENHDYCDVEMPNEDNKIIKYDQGEKSKKLTFIIYADLVVAIIIQKNHQQLK